MPSVTNSTCTHAHVNGEGEEGGITVNEFARVCARENALIDSDQVSTKALSRNSHATANHGANIVHRRHYIWKARNLRMEIVTRA